MKRNKLFLISITGSPASGKSYFSKILFEQLNKKFINKKIYLIEVNDIVEKYSLYKGVDKFGSKLVNVGILKSKIEEIINHYSGIVILVGHLLADIKLDYDIVVVKREHLPVLEKRMIDRGYKNEKIRENLISEALDYCGENIYRGKIFQEIRSDRDIINILKFILNYVDSEFYKNRSEKKYLLIEKQFNEMLELNNMILNGNRYNF